jgi:hypothetical protein
VSNRGAVGICKGGGPADFRARAHPSRKETLLESNIGAPIPAICLWLACWCYPSQYGRPPGNPAKVAADCCGGARQRKQQAAPNPEFEATYGGSAVKILQFYARDSTIAAGQETLLGYVR